MTDSTPEIPAGVPSAGASLLTDLAGYADADPRDLGQSQLSILRNIFEDREYGLFLFSKFICGYRDLTEDLHLPLCKLLSRWGESELADGRLITTPPNDDAGEDVVQSYRRLLIMLPREHFKTSVCTRANALWLLARDPTHNPTIGIFNEKEDNPKSWIQAILDIVGGSVLFQRIWRDMIPKGISIEDRDKGVTKDRNWKWGAGGALFVRDSMGIPELSLEPHGISGTAVGRHYTHMILDDIIGRNAAESPAIMASAVSWVDNQRPLERPAENGNELISCTPWSYNDVYSHKLKKWPGEYVVYRRSILENPQTGEPDAIYGKAIFPGKISTKKAKRMLKTDSFQAWSQYMCLPKAGKQQDFNESWLRGGRIATSGREPVFIINDSDYNREIYDLECGDDHAPQFIPLSWMSKALILDPAPSKPTDIKAEPSAGNGIVVVGKDPWGRRFALDCGLYRETEIEILHRCVAFCQQWGVAQISVEEVNFSAVYQALFTYVIEREYRDFRPDFFPCYTEGRNKDVRIKNLLRAPMQDGYWYFNSASTQRLVQEIAEYPHSATKDLIDALAYTDEVIQRPDTPSEQVFTHYRKRLATTERGITGYGEFM